jgi:hypothetical protein
LSYLFSRFGSEKRDEEETLRGIENLGHRVMWLWVTNASSMLCSSQLLPAEARRQLKIKIECARSCYDSPFDRICAWLALVKKSVHATLTLMFDASPSLMQNWEPHALLQNEVDTCYLHFTHILMADRECRTADPLCLGFCWRLNPVKKFKNNHVQLFRFY